MRLMLSLFLCLGFTSIVLSQFQRATEVARWSNVYALLDETGAANPLKDKAFRERFDAIAFNDRFSAILTGIGLLTCVLAVAGLIHATRVKKHSSPT